MAEAAFKKQKTKKKEEKRREEKKKKKKKRERHTVFSQWRPVDTLSLKGSHLLFFRR